jgi:hypothetical protein
MSNGNPETSPIKPRQRHARRFVEPKAFGSQAIESQERRHRDCNSQPQVETKG